MNTNDPQAEYKREPMLSDLDLGFIAEQHKGKPAEQILEVMETNERSALLSDDHIYGRPDARYVRDFYEAKITSGELMVVKTVELWHPSVPEEEWKKWLTGSDAEFSMLVTKCCSKNPWCPPWGYGKGVWDDKEHEVKWPRLIYVCPGCGANINRP